MKVCWTGTFDPNFERNLRIRDYLEAGGVDYSVVRVNLWPSDRIDAFQRRRLSMLLRMVGAYPRLLFRLLRSPTPDVYLVSYPGWFDVPFVKAVAWLRRRPVVFDVFISLYDTAISDRGLASPTSVVARISTAVDRISMRLSKRVIADCPTHARFLANLADLSEERFGIVYVGADETVFRQKEYSPSQDRVILFYGTFVPLQGVEWIVRAAALLKDREYRFRIVGTGQEAARTIALAKDLDATNLQFVRPMPKDQLTGEIARASLCLGIFGTTPKANRVIPHKVYEAMACGRPVLTGATEAILETFENGEVGVCEVGDAQSLADNVTRLMESEEDRARLGRKGRARFESDFSRDPQVQRLTAELNKVLE